MPRAPFAGLVTALALALPVIAFIDTDQTPAIGGTGTVRIDLAAKPTPIPRNLYGIFFEEINHAGDGGLYGELVRNRGFEDANLPPACIREGNFIIPPRTPHFDTGQPNNWRLRWDVDNPYPSWSLETTGG